MKYAHLRRTRIGFLASSLLFGLTVLMPATTQALAAGDVGPWQTATNSLPIDINTASSAEYNGYVYEIGGSGANNAVYYAKLNSDGSTGVWQTSSNLVPGSQQWRATAIAYNGYLYEIGGYDGSNALNYVYYAPINSDGSIGSWTASSHTLPQGLESLTSVLHDGYVYVIGGNTNGSVNSADVYYAQLNPDGSVGAWQTATNPLPVATRRLTSSLYGNYVYVMGGVGTSTYTSAVYYAKLNSDGTVGAWTTSTNSLPQALEQLTAVAYNGYVYTLGGDNGSGVSAGVYYAPINSDGSIGSWQTATNPLPTALFDSTSIEHNGFVYEFGGDTGDGSISTVYYAQLTVPNPAPAPPAASTSSNNSSKAPNTGYGQPAHSDPLVAALIVGATISTGAGLLLLYRQRTRRVAE